MRRSNLYKRILFLLAITTFAFLAALFVLIFFFETSSPALKLERFQEVVGGALALVAGIVTAVAVYIAAVFPADKDRLLQEEREVKRARAAAAFIYGVLAEAIIILGVANEDVNEGKQPDNFIDLIDLQPITFDAISVLSPELARKAGIAIASINHARLCIREIRHNFETDSNYEIPEDTKKTLQQTFDSFEEGYNALYRHTIEST